VKPKILIVDDEKTLRYFLRLTLQEQGYNVSEAASGHTALKLIANNSFEVALVDLHLTDMDGLDIMRHLRKEAPQTSVIILTGYATVDSAIEALRQGAHDYLTKPCDTSELLASVADGVARQTVLPPAAQEDQPPIIRVQDIELNRAARQVSRNGTTVDLTPTEFDILSILMEHPNTAIDSATLIKQVRGYEATEADARAIARVHIHRLRHKLEPDPSAPKYVTTVAGGRYLISSR